MTTKIAVVTHKKYDIQADSLYLPMMAGSALQPSCYAAGYVRDDTGDNISDRNRSYCELTGLYWMWKNCDADNIGICHYRRYFACQDRHKMRILDKDTAERIIEEYPIVLPKPRNYIIETNYSHYAHAHHAADLDLAREIISEKYPGYLRAYDRRMAMTTGHRFNMMIMRRDLLDQYCSWLFDILFEMEKRLDTSGYEGSDIRVYGYTAERLLDVWLDACGHTYTELPYIFTENENLPAKAICMAARKLKNIFLNSPY